MSLAHKRQMMYVVHHNIIDSAITTLKRDRLSHGMLNVTGREVVGS